MAQLKRTLDDNPRRRSRRRLRNASRAVNQRRTRCWELYSDLGRPSVSFFSSHQRVPARNFLAFVVSLPNARDGAPSYLVFERGEYFNAIMVTYVAQRYQRCVVARYMLLPCPQFERIEYVTLPPRSECQEGKLRSASARAVETTGVVLPSLLALACDQIFVSRLMFIF